MSTQPASPTRAEVWRGRTQSPLGRLILIGIIVFVLQAPLGSVDDRVQERQARRNDAVSEVTGKWGNEQHIAGPVLRIPYQVEYTSGDKDAKQTTLTWYAYFLAQNLQIDTKINGRTRHRGIFTVPVYVADVHLEGHFAAPDFSTLGVDASRIDWSGAQLLVPISDTSAIQAGSQLKWNGVDVKLEPAISGDAHWQLTGIHARLGGMLQDTKLPDADFSMDLHLNGSEKLLLAPAAEHTTAHFASDWPNPSFQGSWLPKDSEIGKQGFTADWSFSYLGRNYPQVWSGSQDYSSELGSALFGVSLANAVDEYRMLDRSAKYGLLTVIFTFGTLWLTEVLARRRMHAVQYLLVGAALSLFGLLQLSLTEQIGFAAAFALSALGVTAMVALYSRAALRGTRHALIVGGVLGGLYAYLYTLLQAEDYSLLGGSLALFTALGAVMFVTRKIDWFSLGVVSSISSAPAIETPPMAE